jgi:peptide chain release factor 2
LEGAKKKLASLEERSMAADFWTNKEENQKVLQQIKSLRNKISEFDELERAYNDVLTLAQLVNEEEDKSLLPEVTKAYRDFTAEYEKLRISSLLDGEYDFNNAILTLHAGAGGTEACDWVDMLLRMYLRWAQEHGYTTEILDSLPGDEAGTKSVTIQIMGDNAYGYLKSEKGVHRLVRISPFDSSGRRHTSFASCDVMPEIEEGDDFEIDSDDLRIDTYRASGAGGQHVNKTESAIRITHIPTNIVVQCQNQRSQHKNKEYAMKILKARILEHRLLEQASLKQNLRGEVKEIGFGSQIRSYVFHPYSLVKDHRTNTETGNIQAVMDGGLDLFITAYLKYIKTKED